jgi:ammonia channel protein AmtB
MTAGECTVATPKAAIAPENLAGLRRAVAILCLLWFSLNAIATAGLTSFALHAWLNLIVAAILAYCCTAASQAHLSEPRVRGQATIRHKKPDHLRSGSL